MSKPTTANKGNLARRSSAARLLSVAGSFGEVQIVAGHDVVFDLQSKTHDVSGCTHFSHATALLPITATLGVEDPRQARLWGRPATAKSPWGKTRASA
jgi:hypothetical protein